MKIVQINTICGVGSTGRIAADLYRLAEEKGEKSAFVYGRGTHPEDLKQVYKTGSTVDFGCHVLRNFFMDGSGFGSAEPTRKMLRWLEEWKPDLIHLHNIHGFYLQIELLFAFIRENRIPVVWTLHDCWPLTGHCAHFDYVGCDKWKEGCYQCVQHRTGYPYALFCDNSRANYIRKRDAFCQAEKMTIVTPSKWLGKIVEQSFLKSYPVKVIPNGIDLTRFSYKPDTPYAVDFVQQNHLTGKKIILGVSNGWIQRKGFAYFEELAQRLEDSWRIILVGVNARQRKELCRHYRGKIIPVERTQNIEQLAALYSLADLFVNPTLEDTFPTTNLEALACSTPVITFRTGGSPEMLDESCGRVVTRGDSRELEETIRNTMEEVDSMRPHCREKALQYDRFTQYEKYISLYHEMMESSRK